MSLVRRRPISDLAVPGGPMNRTCSLHSAASSSSRTCVHGEHARGMGWGLGLRLGRRTRRHGVCVYIGGGGCTEQAPRTVPAISHAAAAPSTHALDPSCGAVLLPPPHHLCVTLHEPRLHPPDGIEDALLQLLVLHRAAVDRSAAAATAAVGHLLLQLRQQALHVVRGGTLEPAQLCKGETGKRWWDVGLVGTSRRDCAAVLHKRCV